MTKTLAIILVLTMILPLSAYKSLIADPIARDIGDLLTVKISESTNAKSQSNQKSDKSEQNAVEFGGSGVLNAIPLMGTELSNKSSMDGGGESSKNGFVSATITVEVKQVSEVGNLIVEGRKKVALDDEESFVILSGIVRPEDITRNNYVSSDRVANLSIKIESKGEYAKAQNKSLIGKVLDWIF
ncbi:MAG: flagellar basal body L-ring protein FlgH [Candidatus Zixiibacteriota bacterium]